METGSKASICNIIKYVSSHDLQIMHIQYAMVDAGTHVEKKKKVLYVYVAKCWTGKLTILPYPYD